MAKSRYSLVQSLLQTVAASRVGVLLASPVLHRLDRLALRLSGGRSTLSALLTGLPVVMVTTTGARSGLPRTLPLLCIREQNYHQEAQFALIASNWGRARQPSWYYNLKANPHARCGIGNEVWDCVMHEATGEEYERYWRRASEIYRGFPAYRKRAAARHIPILVMAPAPRVGRR